MSALIHQRCSNHPGREAAVRCPECGRFFCRECVTEHLGRMMCADCVARLALAGGRSESRASLVWLAMALGGVVFAWLIFYYLGMSLARIPSTFFGGPE